MLDFTPWKAVMPAPSAGRVRRWHYCHPLPSEPYRHLSTHTAQASDNAPATARGAPPGPGVPPARYYGRAGYRDDVGGGSCTSYGPYDRADISALLPTPVGGRLACADTRGKSARFPGGDVPTPIRPITGRRSLPPSSFTRCPLGGPCGPPTRKGGQRAYHVPLTEPGGLGRVSRPVTRHLRRGNVEPPHLATYLLVQAYQQLWVRYKGTTLAC